MVVRPCLSTELSFCWENGIKKKKKSKISAQLNNVEMPNVDIFLIWGKKSIKKKLKVDKKKLSDL